MIGTMKTSYSGIQKLMQCPRAWYLGEYRSLGAVLDKRTGALGFGGRIHNAMEAWSDGTVASPRDAWDELSNHEYAVAAERGFMDTPELDKETELGAVMLEGFGLWWETEGENQEFEVIAVEKGFSNELEIVTDTGEVVTLWLYGKLDRVLRHRDNGQIWVADWKTTKDLQESAIAGVEASPQPRIYKRLVEQALPGEHIAGIRYTFLRKVGRSSRAKPPFYFNHDLNLSRYNTDAHMTRVTAIASRMVDMDTKLGGGELHEDIAPFNPGWYCSTCPFKNVCHVMNTVGMDAADDMLDEEFTYRDPLERYKNAGVGEEL